MSTVWRWDFLNSGLLFFYFELLFYPYWFTLYALIWDLEPSPLLWRYETSFKLFEFLIITISFSILSTLINKLLKDSSSDWSVPVWDDFCIVIFFSSLTYDLKRLILRSTSFIFIYISPFIPVKISNTSFYIISFSLAVEKPWEDDLPFTSKFLLLCDILNLYIFYRKSSN